MNTCLHRHSHSSPHQRARYRAIAAAAGLAGLCGWSGPVGATSVEGLLLAPPRAALQQPVIQSAVAADTGAQIAQLTASMTAWKLAAQKALADRATVQAKQAAAQGAASVAAPFFESRRPVARLALTSGFGPRLHPTLGGIRNHDGVDIAASFGTPIRATADGHVSRAEWAGGYGLLVALEHGQRLQTRYGHMSKVVVRPGQEIRAGDLIGFVGSTGRSTGPHLHYEVRIGGRPVNPLPFLTAHSPFKPR